MNDKIQGFYLRANRFKSIFSDGIVQKLPIVVYFRHSCLVEWQIFPLLYAGLGCFKCVFSNYFRYLIWNVLYTWLNRSFYHKSVDGTSGLNSGGAESCTQSVMINGITLTYCWFSVLKTVGFEQMLVSTRVSMLFED